MNLTRMAQAAFQRAPRTAQGVVTFETKDGAQTTGRTLGVPASASPADSFRDQQMTRATARTLVVLPTGLAFVPAAGMYADWGGQRYNVLAVSPLAPNGTTVVVYRVTIQR
jgi:hypothetical protein